MSFRKKGLYRWNMEINLLKTDIYQTQKKDYRESFLVKEKFTVILTEKLC